MREGLKVDSLEVSYYENVVLQDVSFELRKGEILGLVGESGSGKSTVLKAILGLLGNGGVVTRGDIWFEGKNLPELPKKELRRIRGAKIGMIFQDSAASFCPIRTMGSQIYESMREHNKDLTREEARDRALALFDRLGLMRGERIWESCPFELSGGMNQRVGIAAAMLLSPPVLLADEPTSALDVTSQKQVIRELLQLRELFGTSILLVTHDIGVVQALADHILVLKDGRMVEQGPAAQLLNRPGQPYTRELMAAVPRLRLS